MCSCASFCSQAYQQEILAVNPAQKIKPLKGVSRPSKTLSALQLKELFFACGEQLKVCVVLDAFTGLRNNELVQLKCRNIKFYGERAWVDLDGVKTKSGRGRKIHLHTSIVPMMKSFVNDRKPDEMLFVAPN